MKRSIKVKDGENLTDSNIEYVISLLEGEKPITKKEACNILNITYNTTRLNRILEEYKEKRDHAKKRKAQNRTRPIDVSDKQFIVQEYLSGTSITEIANLIFRSPLVVKNILYQYNIPIRNKAYTYFSPVDLEDRNWAEDYKKGDLVFSARYNSPAYIEKKIEVADITSYRIWVLGDSAQWAFQPYYELADLRAVQNELKVKITELDSLEMKMLINEALLKANKKLKKVSND